jgi:1-deoxy-D-xylulose-5-phosphate reductoisomerase
LRLALEAGKKGGTAPTVLSSSNEEAVYAFIDGKISFMTIPAVVAHVLKKHLVHSKPTLDDILAVDAWAREEARHYIQIKGSKKT